MMVRWCVVRCCEGEVLCGEVMKFSNHRCKVPRVQIIAMSD